MNDYPMKFMVFNPDINELEKVGAIDWDKRGEIISVNTLSSKLHWAPGFELDLYPSTGQHDSKGQEIFGGHKVIVRFREEDLEYGGKCEGVVMWSDKESSWLFAGVHRAHITRITIIGHVATDEEGE